MDVTEFEFLEQRFDELFSYCSLHDKSSVLPYSMTLCNAFLMDISCYLLYLSSSPRNLLNRLYLFRDSMDCNRLIMEQIIEVVCENLSYRVQCFEKPLVVQKISFDRVSEGEKYIPLFLDFFRFLGNAVIGERVY